ncbi:hypothetical protein ACFLTZ_05360 [Chloroflexota bacterium]
MEKLLSVLIAVIIITGIVFGSTAVAISAGNSSNPSPQVTIVNPVEDGSNKKAWVGIIGSGFTPGQELRLLIVDSKVGAETNIMPRVVPEPIEVNDQGSFEALWTGAGRYFTRGLMDAGVYQFMVTDADYNILATAPLLVYQSKEADRAKWPVVADAMFPEKD